MMPTILEKRRVICKMFLDFPTLDKDFENFGYFDTSNLSLVQNRSTLPLSFYLSLMHQ